MANALSVVSAPSQPQLQVSQAPNPSPIRVAQAPAPAPLSMTQPTAQPQPSVQQPPQQQISAIGTATQQTPYTPRLSVDDFASRIKAQYPEYANLDNATLAHKVVAKYPEYQDKVDFSPPPAPQPTDNPNLAQQAGQALVKPLVWAGTRIGQALASPFNPDAGSQAVSTDIPLLGKVTVPAPQSFKQEAGQALQVPALAMGPTAGAATYGLGEGLANNESAGKIALRTGAYALGGKAAEYAGRLAEPLLAKGAAVLGNMIPEAATNAVSEGLGKVANVAEPAINKFNSAINDTTLVPDLATKGIGAVQTQLKNLTGWPDKLATKASQQLEQANLRLTPTQKQQLGDTLNQVTDYLSREKIVGTPQTRFDKVNAIYNNTENTLQSFLTKDAKDVTVPKQDLINQLEALKGNYQSERDVLPIETQIDGLKSTIEAKYPDQIPVARLNVLKRSTYQNAYNQAGTKVLDSVEHDMGDVMKQNIEGATKGMTINGKPIGEFNKDYGVLVNARKLLKIASTRNEIGPIGRIIAATIGGGIGGHFGGPVGAGLAAMAGEQGSKLVAGTAPRSIIGAALRTVGR